MPSAYCQARGPGVRSLRGHNLPCGHMAPSEIKDGGEIFVNSIGIGLFNARTIFTVPGFDKLPSACPKQCVGVLRVPSSRFRAVGVRWGLAKEKRTKGAPMTQSSPARSERQPAKEACQFFPFDPQPVPRARRRFSTLSVQYPRSEFDGSYKRLICRDLLVGKDGRFSKPLPKGDKPRNPSLQIVDLG